MNLRGPAPRLKYHVPRRPLPPTLETFFPQPSWQNRSGRIDRSACLELRISDVKAHADLRPVSASPQPGRQRPQSRVLLEAAGIVTITADDLLRYHNRRQPRHLSGDYRTAKSNAMRPPPHLKNDHQTAPGPDHRNRSTNLIFHRWPWGQILLA